MTEIEQMQHSVNNYLSLYDVSVEDLIRWKKNDNFPSRQYKVLFWLAEQSGMLS